MRSPRAPGPGYFAGAPLTSDAPAVQPCAWPPSARVVRLRDLLAAPRQGQLTPARSADSPHAVGREHFRSGQRCGRLWRGGRRAVIGHRWLSTCVIQRGPRAAGDWREAAQPPGSNHFTSGEGQHRRSWGSGGPRPVAGADACARVGRRLRTRRRPRRRRNHAAWMACAEDPLLGSLGWRRRQYCVVELRRHPREKRDARPETGVEERISDRCCCVSLGDGADQAIVLAWVGGAV